MEPENDGFQKESSFPGTSFQVPCKISGCNYMYIYIFCIWYENLSLLVVGNSPTVRGVVHKQAAYSNKRWNT